MVLCSEGQLENKLKLDCVHLLLAFLKTHFDAVMTSEA